MTRQCASTAYLPEIEARAVARARRVDPLPLSEDLPRIDANSLRGVGYCAWVEPRELGSHEGSPLYGLDADANSRP